MRLITLIFVAAVSAASVSGSGQHEKTDTSSEDEGSKIKYSLFTPDSSSKGRVVTATDPSLLQDGGFDDSLRTIIIVHGWLSRQTLPFSGVRLKDVIFKEAPKTGDYFNVILVDWSPIDSVLYPEAAKKISVVGKQNARLMRLIMNTFDYDADNFHIIGHSLGAHIAGISARSLGSTDVLITGLDPAGPLLGPSNPIRLTSNDSRNLVTIYTCAPFLSLGDGVGHTNIYPAGGKWTQPGCSPDITGLCSHCRAYLIQAEIILNRGIEVQRCTSMRAFQNGHCKGNQNETIYNLFSANTPRGDFYFTSKSTSPYNPSSKIGVDKDWQEATSLWGC